MSGLDHSGALGGSRGVPPRSPRRTARSATSSASSSTGSRAGTSAPSGAALLPTLELFAGLGGLGLALPAAFEVVAAHDQDEAAAEAYEANHGRPVHRLDLATVGDAELLRHEARAWVLGPPCQPFTRRGRRRDVRDPRCRGLLRVIELLPEGRPDVVVLENVVGFFGSRAHGLLRSALEELDHDVIEREACPSEEGAPIRRPRQFVVSRHRGLDLALLRSGSPPGAEGAPSGAGPGAVARATRLRELLDPDPDPSLRIPPELRDRVTRPGPDDGLPLPTVTRSYGRALTGAGPVLWDEQGPRWLSPDEILRLHEFPAGFRLPVHLGLRRRWRLAGNTVHVGCVRRVVARALSTGGGARDSAGSSRGTVPLGPTGRTAPRPCSRPGAA